MTTTAQSAPAEISSPQSQAQPFRVEGQIGKAPATNALELLDSANAQRDAGHYKDAESLYLLAMNAFQKDSKDLLGMVLVLSERTLNQVLSPDCSEDDRQFATVLLSEADVGETTVCPLPQLGLLINQLPTHKLPPEQQVLFIRLIRCSARLQGALGNRDKAKSLNEQADAVEESQKR